MYRTPSVYTSRVVNTAVLSLFLRGIRSFFLVREEEEEKRKRSLPGHPEEILRPVSVKTVKSSGLSRIDLPNKTPPLNIPRSRKEALGCFKAVLTGLSEQKKPVFNGF